jgi:hypothetical protein
VEDWLSDRVGHVASAEYNRPAALALGAKDGDNGQKTRACEPADVCSRYGHDRKANPPILWGYRFDVDTIASWLIGWRSGVQRNGCGERVRDIKFFHRTL